MHFPLSFKDSLHQSFKDFKEGEIDEPFLDVYLTRKGENSFGALSEYLNFTWEAKTSMKNVITMQLRWNQTDYISNG